MSEVFDARRERLRVGIAKQWRTEGRQWTTAEIDSAIDSAIAAEDARHHPPPRPAEQLDLCDHGCHSGRTRAESAAAAAPKQPGLRDAIELYVAGCGAAGATRDEIAVGLDRLVQSVCHPVAELVRAGRLRESPRRRQTRYARSASVLVSPLAADSGGNKKAPGRS